jgi:UDP-glucose 6-dehydrogenase
VGGEADTSFVLSAVQSLGPHLAAGDLVVGKSTVPVGFARCLLSRLREYQPEVRLSWNPEFLREGFAMLDSESPDRIVYGLEDETRLDDVARLDGVYALQLSQGIPRLVVAFAAELAKVAANAFLATKISFINATPRRKCANSPEQTSYDSPTQWATMTGLGGSSSMPALGSAAAACQRYPGIHFSARRARSKRHGRSPPGGRSD